MNIIIVGAGEIGRYLATRLSKESHRISVIESDPQLAADLEQSIDAKVVNSDGTSVSALAEANIGECELFLALTSSNTVNLVASSMAKSMDVAKVVCRVHPELQREEWLFDFKGHFGIDPPVQLRATECDRIGEICPQSGIIGGGRTCPGADRVAAGAGG